MINFQKKLKSLPKNPGVYFFLDSSGKTLYIGKATNLRNRVKSYFSGAETRGHIEAMMPSVFDIDFKETDSVLEALILEANLIKKFQPKYNVEKKDDKSFSYVVITKDNFPRVIIVRATDIDFKKLKTKSYKLEAVYGPYTSKKQLEVALKIIRKIFPYHSNRQETEKGCLDFQLGLCSGPWAGAISQSDYVKNIRGIRMILEGKKKNLLKNLEKEMQQYSKEKEFEKAAEVRNKLFALKHINDIALLSNDFEKIRDTKHEIQNTRIEAYDISNLSGQYAVGSMVVFNNGEPNKNEYRKFKIKTVEGSNDVGMLAEVLFRRFRHSEWKQPDLILLDGGQGHLHMAEKVLAELDLKIPLVAVAKGPTRKNVKVQMTRLDSQGDSLVDARRANDKSMSKSKFQKYISDILNDKNFIKQVMDEAHRFAIGYHRKLRKKSFI